MQIKGKVSSEEIQRYCTLLHEIRTKTEEDIQTYFASGRFNDISVGYLLYALEQIGCKKEDIIKIIQTYEWNAKKITISLHEFSLYNWLPLGVRNVNVYITNIESKDPEDNIMLWQDGREYTPFDCKTEYKEVNEIEFLELSLDMKKRLARRNETC